MTRARLALVATAVAAIFAGALAGMLWFGDTDRSASVSEGGVPAIGGPFALVDQNGETRTAKDFRGQYMLVYFGYTYCPDVCPTTLQDMVQALDMLGARAKRVTPVFITVDPARDTPEHLRQYAAQFSPRLVALTGSRKAIAEAAKAYHVYYAKSGEGDDYLMDHSSFIYLMGPDGRYVAHFAHGISPAKMARRIESFISGS